jgi:hypothetical protein
MISFNNTNLYNCSCDRVFSFFVGCLVCIILCTMFRLIVVLFCVKCAVFMLRLTVVPLPPGENPFAVKIKNNEHNAVAFYARDAFVKISHYSRQVFLQE